MILAIAFYIVLGNSTAVKHDGARLGGSKYIDAMRDGAHTDYNIFG